MKIAPFRLERYFARYEFNVPYLLSSSDCESLSIRELLDLEPGAQDRLMAQSLGYTESDGNAELRAEIAGIYENIEPSQVLVCAGAEEAIYLAMNALLDRGDHVIVHSPCYQSLTEIATAIGCEVTRWQTYERHHWALDLDALRASIRPNTRMIVVNCPHNPTGYLMDKDTQRQIVEITREHGLILFSDEVYRCLEHDPADRLPAAADLDDNAISLGVLSKTYGLAGLRIGWLVTRNPATLQALKQYKDYTSICNSAPSEFLSIVALRHREQIADRNLAIIRRNLDILDAFFAGHAEIFNWWRPNACSIAFPSLKIPTPIEQFCDDVVRRKGVMLLPGTVYEPGVQNFRIGFGRANLPECIEQLDAYLRKTCEEL